MHHHPTRPRTVTRVALGGLSVLTLMLAACGDDDESSSTTAASPTTAPATEPPSTETPTTPEPGTTPATEPESGLANFCAVAEEVNASEPTVELVQRYVDAAPPPIAEPAGVVLAAFEAADGDLQAVFGDPAVLAALEELTAFESDACGIGEPSDQASREIDPDATRVDVTATEYSLDFEMPTQPGRYSFVMVNDGAEPHLMVLLQLEDGATMDDVTASQGEEGVVAAIESEIALPGAEAVVTADLAPGRWVLVCPIPNDAGDSHADLGMVHEFEIS